ncbi:MAG: energy transducer TonB [Pseudomonadota bacterium]
MAFGQSILLLLAAGAVQQAYAQDEPGTPSPLPASAAAPARMALPQKVPNRRREPVPLIAPELWITTTDYPMKAALDGNEGDIEAELFVSDDGKVTGCDIIKSSGDSRLDMATCRLLRKRARFKPALDEQRQPISASYIYSYSWRLPPPSLSPPFRRQGEP